MQFAHPGQSKRLLHSNWQVGSTVSFLHHLLGHLGSTLEIHIESFLSQQLEAHSESREQSNDPLCDDDDDDDDELLELE